MFPIERTTAADRSRTYWSRYNLMKQSTSDEDRALAELMRITARAYEQIEQDMIEDRACRLAGGYGAAVPFTIRGDLIEAQSRGLPVPALIDLSRYPRMIHEAWMRFCDDFLMDEDEAAVEVATSNMDRLVRPKDAPAPAPATPERRCLSPELQPLVLPNADESVIADMCKLLRIEVPGAISGSFVPTGSEDAIPAGLVRSTPEEVEAAKSRPTRDRSHRLLGPADQAPAPDHTPAPSDPARPTRATTNARAK